MKQQEGKPFPPGKRLIVSSILTVAFSVSLTLTCANAGPPQQDKYALRDRAGNRINQQLDMNDTITMANGAVYAAGPAYSPKQTCGVCHDYDAITKAYHFTQGVGIGDASPEGVGVSDHWSDENQNGTPYKYLANAYGHLLSGGQYGAW